MSYLSLSQYHSMNDSLERRLVDDALGKYEPVSLREVFSSIKAAAAATVRYVADVMTAMDEARDVDVRVSGTHW